MSLWIELIVGLWLIVPAYVANASAPLARGKIRMDGGRTLRGQPLFGPGKTLEGFLFAVFVGIVVGLLEILAYPYVSPITAAKSITLPQPTVVSVFMISLGAMVGDLAGSVIKRQSGIPRGEPAPLLDQLDFVVGAFIFAYPFIDLRLAAVVLVIAFTPLVHLMANLIGYKIGAKKVPW